MTPADRRFVAVLNGQRMEGMAFTVPAHAGDEAVSDTKKHMAATIRRQLSESPNPLHRAASGSVIIGFFEVKENETPAG